MGTTIFSLISLDFLGEPFVNSGLAPNPFPRQSDHYPATVQDDFRFRLCHIELPPEPPPRFLDLMKNKPDCGRVAGDGGFEPMLTGAALRRNVPSSSDSQKRDKIKQSFAKGLWQ